MNHGLKSLAQELPKYGRYGDDMVAHINSQEAALLKSIGGAGTINPHTGLPEFGLFGIGGGGGILGTGINKNASDPVSNALSNNPVSKAVSGAVQGAGNAVDQALVGLDKSVGKAIPGGWGTVGMMAASMIPGMTPMMMAGLGALNGSGVLRKGGGFNLQGAMMGGAMAYGMSSLAQYAQGAATPSTPTVDTSGALTNPPPQINIPSGDSLPVPPPSVPSTSTVGSINPAGNVGINPTSPGIGLGGYAPPAPTMLESVGNYVSNIPSNIATSASNAYDTLTNPSTYTEAAKSYGENVAKTGEGIKNLVTGAPGASAAAASNATAQGLTSPLMATAATLYGGTGLAAVEEQRKYLEEQKKANAITQGEYDAAMAEINRSEAVARKAVADNPFSTNPDRTPIESNTSYRRGNADENLYERLTGESRTYAVGGSVDDEPGMDDVKGLPNGNMSNGFMSGGLQNYYDGGMIPNYSNNLQGIMGYAAGGEAKFLSGGGDGMSDSIPATINGKQEARLADGEFVIPADVVSHLGNGSSKAGAKQLYSMMDKVRKARTGTVKQGKQINPRKFLPA